MSSKCIELNKEDQKKLRECQLEILDKIKEICDSNGLKFFLVGGSLLGAVRHKGFIPWDDDIDIGMTRDDYEAFIKICKEGIDKKYYLDCSKTNENCYLSFAKLRMNNTTLDEEAINHIDCHKGIFVDIFPFDIVGNNWKKYYVKGIFIKSLIETKYYLFKIYKLNNCRYKNIVRVLRHLSLKKINKYLDKLCRHNNGNSSHFISFYGAAALKKEYLPKEVLFPLKEIEFEGKMYPGMNDNDTYLSSMYGDYMTLPPKEKRVNHSINKISFTEGKNSYNTKDGVK